MKNARPSSTSTWPAATNVHASATAQATPSAPRKPMKNGPLRSKGSPTSPKAVFFVTPACASARARISSTTSWLGSS